MEGGSSDLKDDDSFEILPSCEEDEFSLKLSVWSGSLNSSFYESMASSYSQRIEESEDDNNIVSFNYSTPYSETKFGENIDFNVSQDYKSVQETLTGCAEGEVSFLDGRCENHSEIDKGALTEDVEVDYPAFEIIEKMAYQHQTDQEVDRFSDESLLSPDDSLQVANLVEDTDSQKTVSTLYVNQSENYVFRHSADRKFENVTVQIHPDEKIYSNELCSVMKHSLKLCRWLRNNKCLQNFVAKAKSSFHIFLNILELEMNTIGMQTPLNFLIIADVKDSSVMEEIFSRSFSGQAVISKCQIEEKCTTTVPSLPVGYNCAMQVVQSKIDNARKLICNSEKLIMVSTAKFIAEIIPQRWQTSTILCLDDPNLQLNLHNFTSTIPVPNEYVYQAQRFTPEDYPLKERGLAITLEDAIKYTVKTDLKDAHEFLAGVNHSVSLKSAANILAGMYKQYVNRFT